VIAHPAALEQRVASPIVWSKACSQKAGSATKDTMRLRFNERKATQSAARLLQLRGGRMSYLKLIKLLYLADREALLRWGRPITTDRFVSMERGPVLSRLLDLVTDGDDPGAPCIWTEHISAPANYEVELKSEPGRDELSDAEIELLDEIFKKYGSKSRWELVEMMHKLPKWKDPQGSAIPITFRDILKAGGKTELEIAAIEDELERVALAETVFGAR
jgi:uncharacterized phage-associated protein